VFDNELDPFARSLDVTIEHRPESVGVDRDEPVDEDD
jgi:hypothetical protein